MTNSTVMHCWKLDCDKSHMTHTYTHTHTHMLQCEALAKGKPYHGLMKNGGKSLVGDIKKRQEIQASLILIAVMSFDANDIIHLP